jgi:WD40 repeat protein
LWDSASGKELAALKGHQGGIRKLAWAADSRRLLSGGDDHTLRLWDSGTGRQIRSFTGAAEVTAVALSSDGHLALSGHQDRSVWLWDLASGKPLFRSPDQSADAVTEVAFSPDGRLALGADRSGVVRVWRLPITSEQALADLSAALAVDKTCVAAYFTRALVRLRRQEPERALADLNAVLRLDPRHARAYYQRGLLYAEREDYRRARADLDQAIRLDPGLALP